LGISLASNAIVMLMTQDAVPGNKELLTKLALAFADPMVAGAYARQVARPEADVLTTRNLVHAPTGRTLTEVRSLPVERGWDELHPWERFHLCNFDNVCSAVRKSVWRDIPFDKADFGEDIIWSQKAIRSGKKLVYVGETFVVHSHDRPIRYDYRRTYLTHRLLYKQYKMQTVPSLLLALIHTLRTAVADMRYARAHERSRRRKILLLLSIPILALTGVFGQYFGARDERLGQGKSYKDI
jgi:rhamnosyltransferase